MKKKKIRLTKKEEKDLQKNLGCLLIFVSFIFLWCGLDFYYKGYHNIDLSWNALGTGVFNITTKDTNNDGVQRTLLEGYVNGMNQTNTAMYWLIFSGITLVVGICQLYGSVK